MTLGLLALLACNKEEEISYEQFNADDDILTIEVGIEELLEATSIDLMSNTNEVVVGSATVTPGGGPAGTEHEIVVEVLDEYEDIVDRVSVRTDSADRGVDEYDLEADYADEGIYKIELQSVAGDGEVRSDTFTIRLWDAVSGGADSAG